MLLCFLFTFYLPCYFLYHKSHVSYERNTCCTFHLVDHCVNCYILYKMNQYRSVMLLLIFNFDYLIKIVLYLMLAAKICFIMNDCFIIQLIFIGQYYIYLFVQISNGLNYIYIYMHKCINVFNAFSKRVFDDDYKKCLIFVFTNKCQSYNFESFQIVEFHCKND